MPCVHLLSLPKEGAAERSAEAAARAENDKERVVLIRDGEPVAAVVPIEDLEALEAEDEYWSRAAADAIAEWEAAGRPPGIPIEDIARDLAST
jgi:PHD/YefM family antitoxin component YafN of YafNO toxin-antitoxin module